MHLVQPGLAQWRQLRVLAQDARVGDLQGNVALAEAVMRQIDDAGGAAAELATDFVALRQAGGKRLVGGKAHDRVVVGGDRAG